MKLELLPFKIGMQYENWEFDLEPVQSKIHLDKYLYIKKDIEILFGLKVQDIFLYFDLEILFKVKIIFKTTDAKNNIIELEDKLKCKKIVNDIETVLVIGIILNQNKLFFTLIGEKYL